MKIMLTKDSDALICLLYKQYLQKRKDGIPKADAKDFGISRNNKELLAHLTYHYELLAFHQTSS